MARRTHRASRPSNVLPFAAPSEAPADEIMRSCVLEMWYLDAGRRVFVAVDRNGEKIGGGFASSEREADALIRHLDDLVEAADGRDVRPLAQRVGGTVFEEPYTDECGRTIFTAVTDEGVRLDSRSAAPGQVERVIASLHGALAAARESRTALRLVR